MREFLFQSQEWIDEQAIAYLNRGGIPGILPCRLVHWNNVIQLLYFTEDFYSLRNRIGKLSAEERKEIAIDLIESVALTEKDEVLSPENIVLDIDSIYLDTNNQAYVLCLPVVVQPENEESRIYVRQVYALLLELFAGVKDCEGVSRRVDLQQGRAEGDWQDLISVISAPELEEDECLVLKSVNTKEPVTFVIKKELFRIGSDPGQTDGCITGSTEVSPLHAVIGWNDINYYVQDLGSFHGTCLNDLKISPQVQVPIGKGSVLRFADCTFSVE